MSFAIKSTACGTRSEQPKNNLPDILARWRRRDGEERERPRTAQSFCVPLIEHVGVDPVFTDFEDELGEAVEIRLSAFQIAEGFERFRAKARAFLREHEDHVAIQKVKRNRPLTAQDLAELQRVLTESGAGTPADIERAAAEASGLGVFVRSLVGLDREAATQVFGEFVAGQARPLTANQLGFISLIVEHLTHHGVMDAALLYESPFTDVAARGPDELFVGGQVRELFGLIRAVRATALAA